MTIAPEVQAILDSINARLAELQAISTSINALVASVQEKMASIAAVLDVPDEPPPPPPPPPDPDPVPTTLQDKLNAMRVSVKANAGVSLTSKLEVVATQGDLTRLGLPGTIANSVYQVNSLPSLGYFANLDIRAIMYWTGQPALDVRNCKVMGIQYAQTASKLGGHFDHVTIVTNPTVSAQGQGSIHMVGQTGWVIDHCDLGSFVDGIQCIGPGLIDHTWFHGLVFTATSHNDGVQNYGAEVTIDHSVFELGGVGAANHLNGCAFNSTASASFTIRNSWLEVLAPDANTNILNAASSAIRVQDSYLKGGRLIGNCPLTNCIRAV